ncbi:MAG: flagellin [Hyphomonas sp.]
MSSILTNTSSMVALETLRNINRGLESVQSEISTGKKIGSAKDNAAIWAISTVMSTDVSSFKQISDSLNLGSSTVGVARAAAEKITETLQEIKDLVVSAQGENVDATKIQTDIEAKTALISGYVAAAQFNGLNLVDGTSSDAMNVLASLDRSSSGVTASSIAVDRVDLSLTGTVTPAVLGAVANTDTTIINNGGDDSGDTVTLANTGTQNITIASVASGHTYQIEVDDLLTANELGTQSFSYVASASDSATSVADNLADQLNTAFQGTNYSVAVANGVISITNNSGDDVDITATATTGGTPATATGGLAGLSTMDVTTDAAGALTAIETLLQTSIDAAASFGSAQNRIEGQSEFVMTLIDSFTTGIGGLTDADMEAASAKLQALQVQQQLGVQALSIANQAPQTLLSLFR